MRSPVFTTQSAQAETAMPAPAGKPRVCIVSLRGINTLLSRCSGFEFEDVIASLDDVEMVIPVHSRTSRLRLKAMSAMSRFTPLARFLGRGILPPLRHDKYEILVFVALNTRDLRVLHEVPKWRTKCDLAVCYIEEIWNSEINDGGARLDLFKQFDLIYCAFEASAPNLAERTGRRVEYIPPGVDTLLFSPDPEQDHRPIDICNIGRRSQITHGALLEHAKRTGKFYYYDTIEGVRNAKIPGEHRYLFANIIKRSGYFIANKAKINATDETLGQEEIGLRFFEGMAGGAVLLGEFPRTAEFERQLGWRDSAVSVPFDCPDIADVIADLDAQPERLARIRRRNVWNCLQRHDWLFRWQTILDFAGLPATARMAERRTRLAQLAARFEEEKAEKVDLA